MSPELSEHNQEVRIHIDEVPEGVELVAGLTATVQVEPDKAPPISSSKPSSANVSGAPPQPGSHETLAEASPQATTSQSPPSQAAKQATPPAPAAQAASQPASQAAQSQAAAQAPQPQSAAQSETSGSGTSELPLYAPPSREASAAAAAADADLKTLEEQIAANPPSGAASPPTAANRGSGTSADMMSSNEYLGQTVDLYDGQSILPAPVHRSPESLHRRARPRWQHGYGHQLGPRGRPIAVTIFAAFRILDDIAASAAHGPVCLAPSVYRQKILLK